MNTLMNAPDATAILALGFQAGGGSANLSFLAYLDVWVISGLVLLAVVVVTGKWLWGRWRRRHEADENGYYDGYDPNYDQEPYWDDDDDN